MAALVSDDLWRQIEPLIPVHPSSPRGGRPRVDDRKALAGIIFVIRTGIPWRLLPAETGCGSGVTCWRRLREWTKAGVWSAIHVKVLGRLGKAGQLDPLRAVVDSASVRAVLGGRIRGLIPPIAEEKGVNGIW